MLGNILLGLCLFGALVSSIWLVLLIVVDVISSNNITGFSDEQKNQFKINSGVRFILMLVTSLLWTIFIMCV